ncbi:efflux RND transporter permease subunit [Serratia ureilytica]
MAASAIAGRLQAKFADILMVSRRISATARSRSSALPADSRCRWEDRSGAGLESPPEHTRILMMKATESGQVAGLMTSLDINAPQLDVATTALRRKVRRQPGGCVRVAANLPRLAYINDFNDSAAPTKSPLRPMPPIACRRRSIGRLQVRNAAGDMLPPSSLSPLRPAPPRSYHSLQRPSDRLISRAVRRWASFRQRLRLWSAARRDAAGRHDRRMDRSHLSAKARGRHGAVHFPLCIKKLAYLILAT